MARNGNSGHFPVQLRANALTLGNNLFVVRAAFPQEIFRHGQGNFDSEEKTWEAPASFRISTSLMYLV